MAKEKLYVISLMGLIEIGSASREIFNKLDKLVGPGTIEEVKTWLKKNGFKGFIDKTADISYVSFRDQKSFLKTEISTSPAVKRMWAVIQPLSSLKNTKIIS